MAAVVYISTFSASPSWVPTVFLVTAANTNYTRPLVLVLAVIDRVAIADWRLTGRRRFSIDIEDEDADEHRDSSGDSNWLYKQTL